MGPRRVGSQSGFGVLQWTGRKKSKVLVFFGVPKVVIGVVLQFGWSLEFRGKIWR